MSDHGDRRWSIQTKQSADTEDCRTHPMTVDGTMAYYFTPGGISAQNKALCCAIGSHERHQVSLCCRFCRAALGAYIFSNSGNQALSSNQQRKDRNTLNFGQSHLNKNHGEVDLQPAPMKSAGELNVLPAEQMTAKQFRARAAPAAVVSIKTVIPAADTGMTIAVESQHRNFSTEPQQPQHPQERPSVVVGSRLLQISSKSLDAAQGGKRKIASSVTFDANKLQKVCNEADPGTVNTGQHQHPMKRQSEESVETRDRSSVKVYENDAQQLQTWTEQTVERMSMDSHTVDIATDRKPGTATTDESSSSKFCAMETNTPERQIKSPDKASGAKKEDKLQQRSCQARRNNIAALEAEGIRYFNEQSYDKALPCCQEAAHRGGLAAQYTLARMYKRGLGVERSWANALEWYSKAAEQGYPAAQVMLGEMYELGRGVVQSRDTATEWYRKAAESDDKVCVIRARVNLALMHRNGKDVCKYTFGDIRLLHAAAELSDYHDARVMHELGTIYFTGNGLPHSKETGIRWWQKLLTWATRNLSTVSVVHTTRETSRAFWLNTGPKLLNKVIARLHTNWEAGMLNRQHKSCRSKTQ